MSDLGPTLRRAREDAGLSLAGMARRTGYSRSYLGNAETGVRAVTPGLVRAYERVLGDDLKRRALLLGGLSSLVAAAAPDVAFRVSGEIAAARSGLLASSQTSHEVDKAIASLVSQDTASLASLVKWSHRGSSVLRVNATGILAKIQSPMIDFRPRHRVAQQD